jgi:hypothetical protein
MSIASESPVPEHVAFEATHMSEEHMVACFPEFAAQLHALSYAYERGDTVEVAMATLKRIRDGAVWAHS